MIRFFGCAIWTIIFLILSIPLEIILFLIGLVFPKVRASVSQFIVCKAFQMNTLIAGTKIVVRGKENVPEKTAVLYVPNHRSIFDIIITYPLCKGQTGYVAKKETKKFPVFAQWMLLMNCQFLDRKDLRSGLKMINMCIDLVKKGTSICIFPEGTRNKGTDPLLEFHTGSFKIAEKTGCPIVPVCITNSNKVFEDQFPKIRPAKVIVEYLPAIDTAGLSREDKKALSDKIREQLSAKYIENMKEE